MSSLKSDSKSVDNSLRPIKKTNLCKKFFFIKDKYKNNKDDVFRLMEEKKNFGSPFEQVERYYTESQNKIDLLEKNQVKCLKSMILNKQQIPETWIIRKNYQKILNKALDDPIVSSFAVHCKEFYKKNSTKEATIDEEEYRKKNLKILMDENGKNEKKFISYINPYCRNYLNSPKKETKRKIYCISLIKKDSYFAKDKGRERVGLGRSSSNGGKCLIKDKLVQNNKQLPYLSQKYIVTEGNKKNEKKSKNKSKEKDKENTEIKDIKNDVDDKLMMTSINYAENSNNGDKDGDINNVSNNSNKDNNKNYLELPPIEL